MLPGLRGSQVPCLLAAALGATLALGCRDVDVDGFRASADNGCPPGFTAVDGRCFRTPPAAGLDGGGGSGTGGGAPVSTGGMGGASGMGGMGGRPQDAATFPVGTDAPVSASDGPRPPAGNEAGSPVTGNDGPAGPDARQCPADGCPPLRVVKLAAGSRNTCAVLMDGSVRCWGSLVNQTVTGLGAVIAISAGSGHRCALIAGGTVRCWGANFYGELGNATMAASMEPVTVPGLTGVLAIASGESHTCALLSGGSVRCWGYNGNGQLGVEREMLMQAYEPVMLPAVGVTALAMGRSDTCAIASGGVARCFPVQDLARLAAQVERVTSLVLGRVHMCALVSGSVRCWGYNNAGQLGTGGTQPDGEIVMPAPVVDLTGVTAIASGAEHTCAIVAGGAVRCWGGNASGQLGNGSFDQSSRPVAVSGLSGATALVAGIDHTCALASEGRVHCWGDNGSGQLGSDRFGPTPLPVLVTTPP